MKAPGYPAEEKFRVETLHKLNILDTVSEERFDRITRMAKRLFSVPIALVSLVDENRQWFKSCYGLDARETGRDVSFCGHAILEDGIFVVRDALADPRFADNPLVINPPHIRFYAGCPLHAANGMKMGTLCIIDKAPREFSADDYSALKDLATMVESEMSALHMATQDELTRILNRRGFAVLAQQAMRYCSRDHVAASLVFLDLNDFKPINDKFGHQEGDQALVNFSRVVQSGLRDSDLLGRMGGDEFVVFLTKATKERAEKVISRFEEGIEEHNGNADRGYNLSFSYGVVEYSPAAHPAIADLLAEGDRLMYQHKRKTKRAEGKSA